MYQMKNIMKYRMHKIYQVETHCREIYFNFYLHSEITIIVKKSKSLQFSDVNDI